MQLLDTESIDNQVENLLALDLLDFRRSTGNVKQTVDVRLQRRFSDRALQPEIPFTAPSRVRPTAVAELTIVIPMFRESARIGRTVERLSKSSLNSHRIEFVFVDDGSDDGSTEAALTAIEQFGLHRATVKTLTVNIGKGGAIKAGVDAAEGKNIGYLDADLSLDPEVVGRCLARLQATNCDMVIGERVVDAETQPRLRQISSRIFRRCAAVLSGISVSDPQCAMKLFRHDVAKQLFAALVTEGFAFDVEVLARATKAGYSIDQVAVAWDHQEGSTLNPIVDGAKMYRQLLHIRKLLR